MSMHTIENMYQKFLERYQVAPILLPYDEFIDWYNNQILPSYNMTPQQIVDTFGIISLMTEMDRLDQGGFA